MEIKVTKATDSMFWYAKCIGQIFKVSKITVEGKQKYFWTHEPSGYTNFILEQDCEVV